MFPILIYRRLNGANGRNWPGFVILDPKAPLAAAVAAQELWEALWKLNPVNLLLRFLPRYRRRMETISHEVEVQAAAMLYGLNVDTYRFREASRMTLGYGGLFEDLTPEQLNDEMRKYSQRAKTWVRTNQKRLEKIRNKLNEP